MRRWKPAKTLKGAERSLRSKESLGVGRFEYGNPKKELDYYGKGYATKRDKLNYMNLVDKEARSLRARYPEMIDIRPDVLYVTDAPNGRAAMPLSNFQAYIRGIGMKGETVGNDRAILKVLRNWKKKHGMRWEAASLISLLAYRGACIRHELAHSVHNDFVEKEIQSIWQNTPTGSAKLVSCYAATDSREYFAEAFTTYTNPGYSRGTLNPDVEALVEKVLGIQTRPGKELI